MFDIKKLKSEIILMDGALGTQLQARGLETGQLPEALNFLRPELVQAVSREYIEAGSQIVCANTFGANTLKLAESGYDVSSVIEKAVALAKACSPLPHSVALDVGPLGELLEPMGTLSFTQAYLYYKEIVLAGVSAGADLLFFETQTDLAEVRAAILAAKENSCLPVFVCMTFEENLHTFAGVSAECAAVTCEAMGVDAFGVNCSLGAKELFPAVRQIARVTTLPLIVKPNAGLPTFDGYDTTAKDFAAVFPEYLKIGVSVVGGCCGTTPEYIRALASKTLGKKRIKRPDLMPSCVCSAAKLVRVDMPRAVGERLNPTGKKRLKQALVDGDTDYILSQVVSQVDAGAEILDINVGVPTVDEAALMTRVVKAVQSVSDIPLQLDSSSAAALEAGLRIYSGKAIVNSVNGEDKVLDSILPLVKKYGAAVVGLTLDEHGVPDTVERRIAIAKKIVDSALFYGISKKDIYIDCLALTVSADQPQAFFTLQALRAVKETLGVRTLLGVSNISFGLPCREKINSAYFACALYAGVDLAIVNPSSAEMMGVLRAYRALGGFDTGCSDYIAFYAPLAEAEKAQSSVAPIRASAIASVTGPSSAVGDAIQKALKSECVAAVRHLLMDTSPLDVVNNYLIPALDEVGASYESGRTFLPQLIQSAETAKAAFDCVKETIESRGGTSAEAGHIILATVKGDVHDIGKNIVKVVLQNYGYRVTDLGKNTDIRAVVDAAVAANAKLVGLSALMTTTVVNMQETIRALKSALPSCLVMVGGAVLTEEYAKKIGADFYAKDATASVRIAKQVFSLHQT